MTEILILILGFYCVLLVILMVGWVRVRYQAMPERKGTLPDISVIVAVRNEAHNIRQLVADLANLQFPRGKFEVIIVNDHSTDNTFEIAVELIKSTSVVRLVDLPDGLNGKKAALQYAINQAQYDVIVTTDADCNFSKHWLECVRLYFSEEKIKMLIGPVRLITDKSFFSRVQALEFISLMGSTASTIGLGHPVMCNGANLAFRKETFHEVNGYEGNLSIASGDDEFLLRKVYARYPTGICFLNFYEAIVVSYPLKTINEFFQQRIRWAGKWRHNTDWFARTLAVFILLAQISFVYLTIDSFVEPGAGLLMVTTKVFMEGMFILWAGRFSERAFDIPAFIAMEIIYPIYITVIGVSSLFVSYQWKNRNYK